MIPYDPRLEFFIFYIVVFITSWTHKGKKNPTQTKHSNHFQVAILVSDNVHLFPPYWENLQLYLNKQELWTVLFLSKATTPTKSTYFIKSCEIKPFSDFPQQQI